MIMEKRWLEWGCVKRAATRSICMRMHIRPRDSTAASYWSKTVITTRFLALFHHHRCVRRSVAKCCCGHFLVFHSLHRRSRYRCAFQGSGAGLSFPTSPFRLSTLSLSVLSQSTPGVCSVLHTLFFSFQQCQRKVAKRSALTFFRPLCRKHIFRSITSMSQAPTSRHALSSSFRTAFTAACSSDRRHTTARSSNRYPCVGLLLSATLAVSRPASASDPLRPAATMKSASLLARDLTIKSTTFSVKNNTPLLVLIIVGSIVLAATVIGSLAWLCCGSRLRCDKAACNNALAERRRSSWGNIKRGSIYSFGDAGSDAGLSLREKSDVSANWIHQPEERHAYESRKGIANTMPLSPISTMPELKDSSVDMINEHGSPCTAPIAGNRLVLASLTLPAPVADSPVRRSRGWQLYDGPSAIDAVGQQQLVTNKLSNASGIHDVEAGCLPPARRPSFIDRLLAHRSISQANAAKMSAVQPMSDMPRPLIGGGRSQFHDRSFTAPITMSNSGPSAPPPTPGAGVAGSALLSAIGGAFRRVSQQQHQSAGRRKYHPSPRQLPIESDYEGTIGGRDAELPMARRADQRRPLCGESINNSPSSAALFDTHVHASPRSFMRSPLGISQFNTPAKTAQRYNGPLETLHTPGVAGIGTTWARRMSESSVTVQQYGHPSRGAVIATQRNGDGQRDGHFRQDAERPQVPWMSVAEQKGPKGRMNDWVASNHLAAAPPPDVCSRRGSAISFAMSERSLPSVSRQNSVMRRPRAAPSVTNSISSSRRAKRSSSALQVTAKDGDSLVDGLQPTSAVQSQSTPITKLASWSDGELQQQQQQQAVAPPDRATSILTATADKSERRSQAGSHVTDYDHQRGALWEDVGPVSSRPPSYRTEPSTECIKKAQLLDTEQRHRHYADEKNSGADEVDAKRRAEKKMRKRMRQARRAAKQAAKEAAALEENCRVARLPAVRDVMQEHADTTTSDSSKAYEQTARHRALDEADDAATWINEDPEVAVGRTTAKVSTQQRPKMWAQASLLRTPDLMHCYQAPVLAHRGPKSGSKATKIHRVGAGVHNSPAGRESRRIIMPAAAAASKKSNVRRYVSRACPPPHLLSPPESPLTSASEHPGVSEERRSSMPPLRPFLVESRRGSQESNEQHASQQQNNVAAVKRGVSMPIHTHESVVRLQARRSRQLPVPPPGAGGNVPLSAYDQLPRVASSTLIA